MKELVFNYWNHDASHPTVDKKDTMRQRVRRKEYVEHAKHVLEKSNGGVYKKVTGDHATGHSI